MTDQLERALGLPHLVFLGVGTMVGAGIYSVIGAAAGEAGAALWISFLFAGAAALLTVLSYAELVAMFPKAGAEYNFLKRAFPEWPLLSFMAGWLIAVSAAATSATVALAFAGYLNVFLSAPTMLTAFALLIACTALNIAGIRQSASVGVALICIEVAGLLLVVWSGVDGGDLSAAFRSGDAMGWSAAGGIVAATALIFFVFIGFEDVANLAEEAKEPVRDLPRALIASVALTGLLYVAVGFAVIALKPPADLAASSSPLTDAAAAAAPWRGPALAVAALFATASTALLSLISISRLLFAMARDGDLPAPLAKTSSARKTPWVAALVLFGAACLLLPLGEVKIVASVSSFSVLLVFAAVQASAIRLRYSDPGRARPFRTPLAIGRLPLPPALGVVIVLGLLTQFEPLVYLVGGGAALAGAALHLIRRSRAPGRAAGRPSGFNS